MILLTIVGAVAWPAVRNRRSGEARATLFVCIAKGESPMDAACVPRSSACLFLPCRLLARPKLGDEEWMRSFRSFVKLFNKFVDSLNEASSVPQPGARCARHGQNCRWTKLEVAISQDPSHVRLHLARKAGDPKPRENRRPSTSPYEWILRCRLAWTC